MTSPLSTSRIDVASEGSLLREAGLRLNGDRLRYELWRRGVTAGRIAHLANVSPNTLTRAMAGDPITTGTLREIARAIQTLPVLPGTDELLATETRNAAVSRTAAFAEGGSGAANHRI